MTTTLLPETDADIDAGAAIDETEATADCLACNGTGRVCGECGNPKEVCDGDHPYSSLVDCGDCKGTGTKPEPKEEYGSPVAGEMDLRDDEPPMTPEAKTEPKKEVTALIGEHELLAEIRLAEELVSTAERRWQDAAEHAKDLKKIYETRVSDLRAAIRGAGPLFCQPAAPPGDATIEERNGEPVHAIAEDAWRSTCIDALQAHDLSETIVAKLRDKSIDTLGDLADFQARHGEFWAKEIKGLGPQKAAKVADAQAAFWAAHPEFCGATQAV